MCSTITTFNKTDEFIFNLLKQIDVKYILYIKPVEKSQTLEEYLNYVYIRAGLTREYIIMQCIYSICNQVLSFLLNQYSPKDIIDIIDCLNTKHKYNILIRIILYYIGDIRNTNGYINTTYNNFCKCVDILIEYFMKNYNDDLTLYKLSYYDNDYMFCIDNNETVIYTPYELIKKIQCDCETYNYMLNKLIEKNNTELIEKLNLIFQQNKYTQYMFLSVSTTIKIN